MSAFIVGKPHLDHLIRVALDGPAGHHPNWHTYWYDGDQVQSVRDNPDAAGQILWAENVRSVNARYQEDTEIEPYTYQRPGRRLSAVEALKALDCYEYQSCEHPGWPSSSAHALCQALRKRLIATLPGYDAAAWEITDERPASDHLNGFAR